MATKKTPPRAVESVSQSTPQRRLAAVLIMLGLLGAATVVWISTHQPRAAAPIAGELTPVSTKPTLEEVARYEVAPDLPKYLAIPTIGLSRVRIMHLGVGKNNQIAAPANLHDAGWYRDSAKPGQAGAMFVYGHVSGREANGAFYDLHKLKAGDKVTVTRGDNSELTYVVVTTKTYPAQDVPMDKVLTPITPGQQGLSLMTCAGEEDPDTHEFAERLVVYATRAKS